MEQPSVWSERRVLPAGAQVPTPNPQATGGCRMRGLSWSGGSAPSLTPWSSVSYTLSKARAAGIWMDRNPFQPRGLV